MKAFRSILAVPAASGKMVSKALASDADAAFLDLEDAVAPDEKAGARKDVVRALKAERGDKPGVFRMNALDTPYFYGDVIEVVEGAGGALDAIIVPKVQCSEDLYALDLLLTSIEINNGLEQGRIKLEAQIESAQGLINADRIAFATPRLDALHFGPGDYAASVRMPQTSIGTADEWDEAYPGHRFQYAMHRVVVAARAAGLRVLDGPVADFRDGEGLRKAAMLARSMGFDGKWCIHPAQIPVVNEVFSPTEKEVEWARRVVEAYEEANAAGRGSISIDGHMVDAASIKMARNTLGLAGE